MENKLVVEDGGKIITLVAGENTRVYIENGGKLMVFDLSPSGVEKLTSALNFMMVVTKRPKC